MTGGAMAESPPDAAELRRIAYRALSALFLYPDDERLGGLAAAVAEIRRAIDLLGGSPFLSGWETVLERLGDLPEDEAEALRAEYTTLFIAGVKGRSCPPYESVHIGAGPYGSGSIGAAVEAVYAEAGLAVGGAAEGELPDHIAVELDFLSYLCGREAGAASSNEALAWRRRQRKFLEEHLLRWLPAFEQGLAATMPEGFYRKVARAAREFAEHDMLLVEALSEPASSTG